MATKLVKKELMNDEIKEFGEDAASTINELLGLYGLEDESKRNELTVKFHRSNYKRIANISQKLMETKRRCSSRTSDSESVRALKLNDYSSVSSDKDSSSRENSKSPIVLKTAGGIDKQETNCSWCHQHINAESSETIGSGGGAVFCSENCFIFWRRASFKRAKTCDFCKNVRNAVSYVDFNDGTTQLQFCSDKCLNQYKMQIFCHETQTHLELNPHLKEKAKSDTNEGLITPDLWLRNCRTRSPTPERRFSKSPSPMTTATSDEKMLLPKIIVTQQQGQPSSSAAKIASSVANLTHGENNNALDGGGGKKLPMINVLPSSKLLSRNMLLHKSLRKRRVSARLAMSSGGGSNKGNQNANGSGSAGERIANATFPAELRAKMQGGGSFGRPPPLQQFMQRPPMNLFKFRLPFPMPAQQPPVHRMSLPPLPPHQHPPPPPDDASPLQPPPNNPLVPPPVSVVLVPYPIPLPIIVPVPLPLTAFMRAYQTKETNVNNRETPKETPRNEPEAESEGPLDLSSEHGGSADKNDDDDNNNNNNDDFDEEKMAKRETTTHDLGNVARRNQSNEYTCESNRPLRKRKIISTEVDERSSC